ncbi:hypothetical protein PYW07_008676 [Mythimna separata]|uniref:Uncharacterized protein n=1 Tax=Mythimna separata TaxID=271217 RepID=A0AAD7YD45_MYTSE|nr:hypothetical protein PYW07_008676 [Mythimna separata]
MSRLCVFIIASVISFVSAQDYGFRYTQSEIVPDVLSVAPFHRMTVLYHSKSLVEGDILTPTEVKDIPLVTWDNFPDKFYTVVKTDPDAPSRQKPTYREWLHWMVVNVPGDDIAAGDTIAEYVGAGPSRDTGLHRYVLLVYEQPDRMRFNETRLSNRSMANRTLFSVSKFAKKYNLGDPIAGNFYRAAYDDYVPKLYRQLSGRGGASGGQRTMVNCYMIALMGVIMVAVTK